MSEDTSGYLAPLVTQEWRRQWWEALEREQPEVAARLVAKFPRRYPVPVIMNAMSSSNGNGSKFPKVLPCLVCGRARTSSGPGDRIHPSCKRSRNVSDIELRAEVHCRIGETA